MTISVESWRTIAKYPDRAAALFADLCVGGDIDSVRNALDEMERSSTKAFGNEQVVLVSLLGLFECKSDVPGVAEKQALVARCLQACSTPAAGLDAMVTLIQKITEAPGGSDEAEAVEKLRALASGGVNGHLQPHEARVSPVGFLFRQLVRRESEVAFASATKILDALFGDEPIRSLRDQPGIQPFSHADSFINQRVSLFEAAIIRNYKPIIAWAAARVPPDNDEVWQDIGDQALHVLGISVSGSGAIYEKDPYDDRNRERDAIESAYRLIGAGAKMRFGKPAWDAVINRPSSYSSEKTYFDIAQGASTVTSTREEAVPIIEALIREGGMDINAYDSQGRTLLMHAANASNERMVEMLLLNGADTSVPSNSETRETAMDCFNACSRFVREQEEGRRVEALLRAAAAKQAIDIVRKRGAKP